MRWLVLCAALQQFFFPFLVNPFRDGADRIRANEPSQIEPAGYAFAIWALIYTGALVYSIWQLTASGRSEPVTERIAPYAVALYIGSSLWLLAADRGPVWATMPLLAIMAVCAAACLLMATSVQSATSWRYWLVVAPFAMYAGWTACATFVNIAEVAPPFGFSRFGLSTPWYGALSIAAAAASLLALLLFTGGDPVLAATGAWALVGILVAGVQRSYGSPVMVAAGLALFVVASAFASLRWRAWPA